MAKVKCLKCVKCGREYDPAEVMYHCPICGVDGTLDVLYDYQTMDAKTIMENLRCSTEYSLWRYLDLLPVSGRPESLYLNVGWTPLYRASRLQNELGLDCIYIKDDGRNPTASFKDRATAIGVTKAIELNRKVICAASTGNAASSLSGFAACAGIKTYIFVPASAPEAKITQLLIYGSNVILVDGTYDQAFELCLKASKEFGWYNRSCALNPYLVEGKKTVSYEIAEQMDWHIPDRIVMSIGDGCCISGAWKGFYEMYRLGMTKKLPVMTGVQSAGSNPVNRAFREGVNHFTYKKPDTIADSISVGIPRNGHKALRALRESNGDAVDVSDNEILTAMKLLARSTGVFGEPAGVAGLAGLIRLIRQGKVRKNEKIVLIITGNGLKDIKSAMAAAGKPVFVKPDMDDLVKHLSELNIE